MERDPFFRAIRQGLKGKLDPDAFERAAVDLLREAHPGIASVSGGSDSGMDGAIPDGVGEPLPLITTTAQDAIGNLSRNLNKYIEDGGPRRNAVFATSRQLSPKRKQNLYKRARELGFTLLNIHDQEDIAMRLYRDPAWCRELLNLSGDPPSLSSIPHSKRPLYDLPLIGRDQVSSAIAASSTDFLLIGQPGSGKTYLLQHLVNEGGAGLFVISSNRGAIAEGIRAFQPKTVIVDDAHVKLHLLAELVQLRRQLKASFQILASSWPGQRARVEDALGLASNQAIELELLSRDEIVEVIRGMGLTGPTRLLAEITNQAEGRPGLAVTLAHLCRMGNVRDVMSGQILARSIITPLEDLVGIDTKQILAVFAVAGDSGLPMSAVAEILQLSSIDLQNRLMHLAAAGVIFDRGESISVRPRALRHVLIRDVFFRGATSLPQSILDAAVALAPVREAAETLFGARARGAKIPFPYLTALAEESQLWEMFAWTGHEASSWLLENKPEQVGSYAEPALEVDPARAIHLLLERAEADLRPLNMNPGHPLRVIEEWSSGVLPRGHIVSERRRELLRAVGAWLDANRNTGIALRCIPLILSPNFNQSELDPGEGRTVTFRRGILPMPELSLVWSLWPEVFALLKERNINDWLSVLRTVHEWLFNLHRDAEADQLEFVRVHGLEMVRDLYLVAKEHPGVGQQLRRKAAMADAIEIIPPVPIFDHLFPIFSRGRNSDIQGQTNRALKKVKEIAEEWASWSPGILAAQLASIEREQRIADLRWPDFFPHLCEELAKRYAPIDSIVVALMEAKVEGHLLLPFAISAARQAGSERRPLLESMIMSPQYSGVGVVAALRSRHTPQAVIDMAIVKAEHSPWSARLIVGSDETKPEVKIALLGHKSKAVSLEAIKTLHPHFLEGKLPDKISSTWRSAFLRHGVDNDHWVVTETLDTFPSLAFPWLQSVVRSVSIESFPDEDVISAAVNQLATEERTKLIQEFDLKDKTHEFVVRDCVSHIANTPEAYRALLSRKGLTGLHLAPLETEQPNQTWKEMVIAAIEHGYPPKQIADAVDGSGTGWTGSEAEHWRGKAREWELLLQSGTKAIREIAQLKVERYRTREARARARERKEAIFGRRG